MATTSDCRPRVMLACLACLAAAIAAAIVGQMSPGVAAELQVEFPGSGAYARLDAYLQRFLKVESFDSNLKLVQHLIQRLESKKSLPLEPKKLIDAAKLVLALKEAADEERCDPDTIELLKLNLRGTNPNRTIYAHYDHPDHLAGSKLAAIIAESVLEIVYNCEPKMEDKFNKLTGEFARTQDYKQLTDFLSNEFVEKLAHQSGRLPPQLGALNQLINEAPQQRSFMQLPLDLMMGHLFQLAGVTGDQVPMALLDDGTSWPFLNQTHFEQLLDGYLVRPCQQYVALTKRPLMEMFHWTRSFMSEQSFSTENFMKKRSPDFKYKLFRYEFCHLYSSLPVKQWFWIRYRKLVAPMSKQ